MADLRMTLLDLLNKSEQGADPTFLRDGIKLLAQELMDAEVSAVVGAQPHQRTLSRITYRNGYRDREWDTRVGTVDLQIPKLREGTYFPSLLEPRRRHERALLSVVQEAYIHGDSLGAQVWSNQSTGPIIDRHGKGSCGDRIQPGQGGPIGGHDRGRAPAPRQGH